jgi:hypothetical protein
MVVEPVHGAYGAAGGPDGLPAGGQGRLARPVQVLEVETGLLDQFAERRFLRQLAARRNSRSP